MTPNGGYRWEGNDLLLMLRIQPRASRDEFAGCHGDQLKLRVTAPPVDGKANAHILRYLAKTFDVPRASVRLLRGKAGRDKQILVHNPSRLPPETGIHPASAEK